ncbi:MAG: hypothetical protein AAF216_13790 [Pseudomonadota bacterium]
MKIMIPIEVTEDDQRAIMRFITRGYEDTPAKKATCKRWLSERLNDNARDVIKGVGELFARAESDSEAA